MGRETIMNSEPILPVLGDMSFIIATTLIFTKDKCLAIVSPLDVDGYKMIDGIDKVYESLTAEQLAELRVQDRFGEEGKTYEDTVLKLIEV